MLAAGDENDEPSPRSHVVVPQMLTYAAADRLVRVAADQRVKHLAERYADIADVLFDCGYHVIASTAETVVAASA